MDELASRLEHWGWPHWVIGLFLAGWALMLAGSRAYARWRHQEEISGHWRGLYDQVKQDLREVRCRLANVEGNHQQCRDELAAIKDRMAEGKAAREELERQVATLKAKA